MYGPGCWTRAEIRATPAIEVVQHIVLAQRADSLQKQWTINLNSFHRFDKMGRRRLIDVLNRQANTGRRVKKATELVNEETRVLMIGCELLVHGDRWARRNRDEMNWLETQGVTRSEAIRRHSVWMEHERADPFWRPAKGKK